jgi:mannan endo-1,4-beta-mannosidase
MNRNIAAILLMLTIIVVAVGAIALLPTAAPTPSSDEFVRVVEGRFSLGGQPYTFVGANFWQGMNLAADGPGGDRTRLLEELDRMQALGLTNLRVMASSEGPDSEPQRMVPALLIAPGVYNKSVLDGLDFLLAEMGKRNMKAVMVLNNYWQWSGGMAQYVSWSENSPIPYPGDYGTFMAYSAKFYDCANCQIWYRDHIEAIVTRLNPYTNLQYRDDPTIFSWELANEPRSYPDSWIDDTAAYIKSLDPNHMVTTGSEGSPPGTRQDFRAAHDGPNIDYATIHIWPQNWGWYDPENPSSYQSAESNARRYFQSQLNIIVLLKKPMVLEEFGLARDYEPLQDIYNPNSPTTYRDLFYAAMFEEVDNSASSGGPVMGDNFWAWGGHARPGEDLWVGDPPHEPPGWYSVFDTDDSTQSIIAAHAEKMKRIMEKGTDN